MPQLRPRVAGRASWFVCGIAVVLAVVRLLGLDLVSPLVLAMAYHPYLVVLTALLLVVPFRAGQARQLVIMALALVIAAAPILPRMVGGGAAADDGGQRVLRVATLNMFFGSADIAEVVALATEVEVLALQEVTEESVQLLTAAGLADVMPYRVVDVRDGPGGSGIWSRYPLVEGDPLDSVFAMPSASVIVRGTAEPVTVQAVHPVPPINGGTPTWRAELGLLAAAPMVDVLLGDFNATLDHRSLRRVMNRGYTDVADALGQGLASTWPAQGVPLPGIVIDHVMTGPDVRPLTLEVRDVTGTDHRALIADVLLP